MLSVLRNPFRKDKPMTKYLPVLLLSLAFGGCFAEVFPGEPGIENRFDGSSDRGASTGTVQSAQLSGRVGQREAIGQLSAENSFVSSNYAYVSVHARSTNNVVMNAVSIENLGAFTRGQDYTFSRTSSPASSEPVASVLGCSGASDSFDIDVYAELITIRVEDTADGGTLINYTASFGDEGRTEGSFIIAN